MWSPQMSSDRKFWLQFLEKYKSFRYLWDTDERAHTDRAQRNAAYEELAEMTRVIAPDANVLFVKNRIASFRTCYRREIKKVKAAKANGTTYKPSLFYFNALKFLDPDEDDTVESANAPWDNEYSDNEDPFCTTKSPEPVKPSAVKRIKAEVRNTYDTVLEKSDDGEESDNSIQTTTHRAKRVKTDEYELLGQRIAAHFRKMDDEQSLIAEKIISDVCFYGRMKALTMQTSLNLENVDTSNTRRHRYNNRRNDYGETVDDDNLYEDVEITAAN